jgi:hypothetical protein
VAHRFMDGQISISGNKFSFTEKPFFGVKILKFFDPDPKSGMEKIWIRDGK